jgi:hypothetical protein
MNIRGPDFDNLMEASTMGVTASLSISQPATPQFDQIHSGESRKVRIEQRIVQFSSQHKLVQEYVTGN